MRFARAGGTHEEYAFGDAPAQTLKFARIFQKFDDFLKFLFGFFGTCNVFECDFGFVFRDEFCLAFAKAECAFGATLHLAQNEKPKPYE